MSKPRLKAVGHLHSMVTNSRSPVRNGLVAFSFVATFEKGENQ